MESSVTPRAREDEARARAKRRARAREGGDDGVVEVGGGTRGARAVTSGVCLDDDDDGEGVGVGAREDAGETTRAALETVVREETRRPVYARDGGRSEEHTSELQSQD